MIDSVVKIISFVVCWAVVYSMIRISNRKTEELETKVELLLESERLDNAFFSLQTELNSLIVEHLSNAERGAGMNAADKLLEEIKQILSTSTTLKVSEREKITELIEHFIEENK